jgi:hypothetical protein
VSLLIAPLSPLLCGREPSSGLNQGANALIGHDFEQQGVFNSAINDVD